jgi:hypothetical protein
MIGRFAVLALLAALCACSPKSPAASAHRATMNKLSANVVEVVPSEGQPPYCLIFTVSEHDKVIRQLTMSRDNRSFSCPAGTPVGGLTFRVPVDEGGVKLYVLFSDQRLNAGSIAQQLFDLSSRPAFNVLDLRAPGRVVSERFDFVPEEEPVPATGALVGAGGELAVDGGVPDAG